MGNLWSLNPADWFTDEERGTGVNVVADPYEQIRGPFLDWLQGQIGQAGPSYGGQYVSPMSPQEQQSFDFLRQYGEGGYGSTFQAGRSEIEKTLGGQYNPANSPYYQAVKAEAARNLAETQKNIERDIPSAREYFSGARTKNLSDAAIEQGNFLNTILGGLAEKERQNMMNVLPLAYQYGQAEKGLPLQQAQAYQSLGGLPRMLEQQFLDAQLQDWLRSQYNYPLQIAGLAGQTQQPPLYQQNQPSFLYELLMNAAQGASQAATLAAFA